jgi:aminoglycoside phosphotransferase (APT) family kinase protein
VNRPVRLAHGYTNEITADGERVVKRYMGADADRRMRVELDAIALAADRVAVPRVLDVDPCATSVVFVRIRGRHGQELIDEGRGGRALAAAGRALHDLHRAPAVGLVHGDYGPQNLLHHPDTLEVAGVLDWEFAHDGEPIEDLAWAEWIVRMHHPGAISELPSLFEGYGARPAWDERQATMLAGCRRLEARASRLGDATAAALWSQRAVVTAGWLETAAG